MGLVVTGKSEKTGWSFNFGTGREGFFLEMYLLDTTGLKNMKDDFWETLVRLNSYGNFTFEENAGFDIEDRRKAPHLFRNKKGNVFKLMRNYFLFEAFHGESNDIGWLKVSWPLETQWLELLTIGKQSI